MKSAFYFTKKKELIMLRLIHFLTVSHQTDESIIYKPSDMYKHSNKPQPYLLLKYFWETMSFALIKISEHKNIIKNLKV